MRILHVSTTDKAGGAEKMAYELFQMARQHSHDSCLAVGRKSLPDPAIIEFPNNERRRPWAAHWRSRQESFQQRSSFRQARLSGWLANLGEPGRWRNWHRGHEDFDYPAISQLEEWLPWRPDIIHLHNLHGNYFDLRALSRLSARYPVVMTMHDEWLYTGHCAYTFECERWRDGCGKCPDLQTYPALKRDGTRFNLERKREIYRQSRVHVAASSHWVVERALASVLKPAIVESRVIRYGIDLDIFQPAVDRRAVRAGLDLPPEALVVLFIANRTISNPYKDYATLEKAVSEVAEVWAGRPLYFICVGEEARERRSGNVTWRYHGYQGRQEDLARFYQAADLYLHAARAEAFGLVMAEAMACRLPVIATAIGGIPEVVDHGRTGILVPPGDSAHMAESIIRLLNDDSTREEMAENGYLKARADYDRQRHGREYLEWYEQILAKRDGASGPRRN